MSATFVVCLLSLWVACVLAFVHADVCSRPFQRAESSNSFPSCKEAVTGPILSFSIDPEIHLLEGRKPPGIPGSLGALTCLKGESFGKDFPLSLSPGLNSTSLLPTGLWSEIAPPQHGDWDGGGGGGGWAGVGGERGIGSGVEEQTVSVFSHQNPFRLHSITSYCDFQSFPGVKGLCWRRHQTVSPHLVAVLCGRQS